MNTVHALDLTQRPPRSPRVRLGGYVILPRMLDKGRALLNGKNGLYNYACPLDQHFLNFSGINPDQLKEQLAAGKSDGEILEWIRAQTQQTPWEIAQWSAWHEQRSPGDVESIKIFKKLLEAVSTERDDISTWFDLLDLDDYVSYGFKP